MNNNFWEKLEKPILALAPMAGFTTSSFRQVCQEFGADVLYSEMVSSSALYYNSQVKIKRTLNLLKFDQSREQHYLVQLFGSQPEHFAQATRFITEKVKPAGIDINFGCPVNKVTKQGAGAELMKDLDKSYQVVKAVIANTDLPVSIKIRSKAGKVTAIDLLKKLSGLKIAAVMIHGRSLSQGFVGPVDWSIIKEARRYFKGIILANGGINDLASAQIALQESQADGLGLARGVLGRPWLFTEIKTGQTQKMSQADIFQIIIKQATQVEKEFGSAGIIELRKHLCWYVQGLTGASRLREKLVKVKKVSDISQILKEN